MKALVLLILISTVVGASQARAMVRNSASSTAKAGSLRVRECSYDIHGARNMGPRTDGYFQNDLEMHRISPTLYRGSVPLMGGYRLGIEAILGKKSIVVKSTVHAGAKVAIRLNGISTLPANRMSKAYTLSARREVDFEQLPTAETGFDRVDIRCVVGPNRLRDRAIDLLN